MADTTKVIALATVVVLATVSLIVSEATLPQTVLHLERMPSTLNHTLYHPSLRAQDRFRHSQMWQQSANRGEDTVNFPLEGLAIAGVYFAKVKLGSRQKEFKVIVDTGSDIPWITCSSCHTCPRSSGKGVKINFYDPSNSSTAHIIHCSDPLCVSKNSPIQCSLESDHCLYSIQYQDKTIASGYYVSDELTFGRSPMSNSSATIVLGCSNYHNGGSIHPNTAFDGLFGFGQGAFSIISQFSAKGLTPRVFSQCLRGGPIGGGIIVFGEIMEPDIVYAPLIPSRTYYGLHLESVSVSGLTVFAPRLGKEIAVDSGTTMIYLVEDSYNFLINSITTMVSPSFTPITSGMFQCYIVPTRFNVSDVFPTLSLNFTGGAAMVLKPEQYIMRQDGPPMGCTIFTKSENDISIIGELALRDTLVVYDLARQRLGWVPFDCSKSINVSNTEQKANGGSRLSSPLSFIVTIMTFFLLHVF